jgi:hypothetical protein
MSLLKNAGHAKINKSCGSKVIALFSICPFAILMISSKICNLLPTIKTTVSCDLILLILSIDSVFNLPGNKLNSPIIGKTIFSTFFEEKITVLLYF